jgi:beta-N-acetylhexosaminidase
LFDKPPRPLVLGCAGPRLGSDERRFFAAADPLGFILFARNCREPDEVQALVAELRQCVGRADAPVLIDQEGGRVQRLRPPRWRAYPAAGRLARLPDGLAEEAVWLGARLVADDLARLGITVDCAPVLDLPVPGADAVIGDRAYGGDPARVAALARACCEGLLAGGVLPVLKHVPGHGRALVDSHLACPRVTASRAALAASDFAPFRALALMPWAMTAHIVFAAIDDGTPATLSRPVIEGVVRGEIGFDGVLISDDLSMGALAHAGVDEACGDSALGACAVQALDAGCDLLLHCNGILDEMAVLAEAVPPLAAAGARRVARAELQRRGAMREFDRAAALARFEALEALEALAP